MSGCGLLLTMQSAQSALATILAAAVPGGVATAATGAGSIGLREYLVVSALTFALGVLIIIIRRNAIAVLMGIELLMNSAGLNFVAFSKFVDQDLVTGQVINVFVIVVAAAEAALALAIILNIHNNLNTVEVDEADALSG